MAARKECEWRQDEGGTYNTGCGEVFAFNEGGPAHNDAKFCIYCGGKLVEIALQIESEGE